MDKTDKNKEAIMKNVQFFNQLDLTDTRYAHLNPKGTIYCFRDKEHEVLNLSIKFEGLTQRFERLLPF